MPSFHVSSDLGYNLSGPATFLFALKCIETGGQKILGESLIINPQLPVEEFTVEVGMNRFTRLKTTDAGVLNVTYSADVQTTVSVVQGNSLSPESFDQLTPHVIPFLFPSRYCQSDRLRQQAADMFGHLNGPYALASGIAKWIYEHVTYQSGASSETSSAVDTLEQRQGVCRDFAHLGIAFCRAMNVPARYVTCYAHLLNPPDFHALFEVYIGGFWYIFDATGLAPLNGLVRIATGRDAADAAVCNIFGGPQLTKSVVACDCTDTEFQPLSQAQATERGEAVALL